MHRPLLDMLLVVLASLILLFAHAPNVNAALSVETGPVDHLSVLLYGHCNLERRWTIAENQDANDPATGIRELIISIPGRVFVSHGSPFESTWDHFMDIFHPSIIGSIRISGSAEVIFDLFEVAATGPHTLEIRQRPGTLDLLDDVYVLVELGLQQTSNLERLVVSGSGEVVIEDEVLVTDRKQSKLRINHAGSGMIYLRTTAPINVDDALLEMTGTGDLYWFMISMTATKAAFKLTGTGEMTIISQNIKAMAATIEMANKADVCVSTGVLSTTILSLSSSSSGDLSIACTDGKCMNENIEAAGAGDVLAGSIACQNAMTTVHGGGSVILQASMTIAGVHRGRGMVSFFGTPPKRVSDQHDAKVFSVNDSSWYKPLATPTDNNRVASCAVMNTPDREAVPVKAKWITHFGGASWTLPLLILLAVGSVYYLKIEHEQRQLRIERAVLRAHQRRGNEAQPQPMMMPMSMPMPMY